MTTTYCSQLSDLQRKAISDEIAVCWKEIAAQCNVRVDDVLSYFANEGSNTASRVVSNKFVTLLCQSSMTLDEFYAAMRKCNKGGIAVRIQQKIAATSQQAGTSSSSSSSLAAVSVAQATEKATAEMAQAAEKAKAEMAPVQTFPPLHKLDDLKLDDLDDAFAEEEEKNNRVEMLSEAISRIATRQDVLAIMQSLNAGNDRGVKGWDMLLGTLEGTFPEAVIKTRRNLHALFAKDANENIALRCMLVLLKREQFATMTWPQFLDRLAMLGHAPTATIASSLRATLQTKIDKTRSENVIKVENAFNLEAVFDGNSDITFKPGKSAADVIRYLAEDEGVQNLAHLNEILDDASSKTTLMAQGITGIGYNALKRAVATASASAAPCSSLAK